jgi:hypothetical protein
MVTMVGRDGHLLVPFLRIAWCYRLEIKDGKALPVQMVVAYIPQRRSFLNGNISIITGTLDLIGVIERIFEIAAIDADSCSILNLQVSNNKYSCGTGASM